MVNPEGPYYHVRPIGEQMELGELQTKYETEKYGDPDFLPNFRLKLEEAWLMRILENDYQAKHYKSTVPLSEVVPTGNYL